MRNLLAPLLLAPALLLAEPAAAIKRVAYPEIRVRALPAFPHDAGLAELRKKLADAVAAKDVAAAAALVGPKFLWTAGGVEVDEFDPKRDAIHNFKVAFGFRAFGRDADGPTEIGPQWELLAYFATDKALTREAGAPLVCTSLLAKVTDAAALEDALMRIDEENDLSEWVYFIDELTLTATPAGGSNVAKLRSTALPVVSVHPPAREGVPQPAPTHFELLLPSGQTGWAAAKDLHPLFVDRLCFAQTGTDWKIALYEQAE